MVQLDCGGEGWDAFGVFDRLTEQARRAVVLAQDEARRLRHDYVGSEHLLLGLLAVQDSVAAHVLGSLGITLQLARDRVVRTVGSGEENSPEAIPFTPRSKRLLVLALQEALNLNDDYIGTEHMLLAVASENEAVAAGILRDVGVDLEQVRRTVTETRPAAEGPPPAETVPPAGRVAGGSARTRDNGPRVTSSEVDSDTYGSAPELARAFGGPVIADVVAGRY